MLIDWLRRRMERRLLLEALASVRERETLLAGKTFNAQVNLDLGLEAARISRLLKEIS